MNTFVKRAISLLLSVLMVTSVITGVDFSVYAEDINENGVIDIENQYIVSNDALEAAISDSEEVYLNGNSNYTPELWNNFVLAYELANEKLEGEYSDSQIASLDETDQIVIDGYVSNLLNARKALYESNEYELSSDDIVDSGSCGNSATWTIDSKGTLEISGTGEIDEILPNELVVKELIINEGIESVSEKVSFLWGSLQTVKLPASLKNIHSLAFILSLSLESIYVDPKNENYCSVDGVLFNKDKTVLISYAKAKTDASYVVPNGVTSIEFGSFIYSLNLKKLILPDTLSYIGVGAFGGCMNLTSINIPDSVKKIDLAAFALCSSLTSLEIPDGVTGIDANTFFCCESLTNLVIPSTVKIEKNDLLYGECAFCLFLQNDEDYIRRFLTNHNKQTGITSWNDRYYSIYSYLNNSNDGNNGFEDIVFSEDTLLDQILAVYDFLINSNQRTRNFYELYELCEANKNSEDLELAEYCRETLENLNLLLKAPLEASKQYDERIANVDAAYKSLRISIGAVNLKTATIKSVGEIEYNGTKIKNLTGDEYQEGIDICNSVLEYIGVNFRATNVAEALMYYYVLPTGYDYTLNNANANSKAITFVNAMLYAKLAEEGGKAISGVTIPTKTAPTDPFSFAKDVYTKLFDANGSATIASTRSYDTFCSSSFEAINKSILLLSGDYADMAAVNKAIEQAQISDADLEDLKAHTVDGDLSSLYNYIFSNDCKLTKYEKEFFDLLYKGDTTHSEFSIFNNELYASVDNAKAYKLNKATTLRDASKLRNGNVIMSAVDFYNDICSGIMTRLDINSGKNIPSATFVSKSSFDFIEANKFKLVIKPAISNLKYSYADYNVPTTLKKKNYTVLEKVEPTCKKYGYIKYACDKSIVMSALNGSAEIFYDLIKPLENHNYIPVITRPTPTSQGYTTYTCECGESYVSDYTDYDGIIASGECGYDAYWILYDNDTLFIYGTGVTFDYREEFVVSTTHVNLPSVDEDDEVEYEDKYASYGNTNWYYDIPWYSYKNDIQNVIIYKGVTTIGSGFFYSCDNIDRIDIPDSITDIGDYAFDGCTSLSDVYYEDTEDQWDDIEIGIYNESLTNANIHFNEYRHEHAFVSAITEPTCTENGYTTYSCECGHSYVADIQQPLGHEFVDYVSDGNATCLVDGTKTAKCSRCDELSIIKDDGSALGHDYKSTVVAPTCTEKGYTINKCARCNDTYNDNYVNALGHKESIAVEENRVDPTCTEAGSYESAVYCSVCHVELTREQKTINILGHNYKTTVVLPTCITEGYTVYSCTRCDYAYNADYVGFVNHKNSSAVAENRVEPNCIDDGSYDSVVYCSVCHIELSREQCSIKALGHSFDNYKSNNDATCVQNGTKTGKCIRCKETNTITDYNTALGHSFTKFNSNNNATCEKNATETAVCDRCDVTKTQEIPNSALGHDLQRELVKPATILETGEYKYTCSRCGRIYTEVIPKKQVDITESDKYGIANLTVVNAQTKEPIKNAQIFVSTENDGEATIGTNNEGKVSITLPAGKIAISVYGEGYLTRNINIKVEAGVVKNIPLIGLSDKPVYDAKLTATEMTYDEIIAAGIDPNAKDNNHVYKYELRLDFEPQIDAESILAYFNGAGSFLGFGGSSFGPEDGEGCDSSISGFNYSILHYATIEECYNGCCTSLVYVCEKHDTYKKGTTASLNYIPWRDPKSEKNYHFDGWYSDYKRTNKISSIKMDTSKSVYGVWKHQCYKGDSGDGGFGKGLYIPTADITLFPVNEYFYIIIRGEVKWLKEMFDVEMLVFNNSEVDTMENMKATLTLPDGLSLATMIGEQQTLEQDLGTIPEGGSKDVHWYVRGDKEGSYNLQAQLTGITMPFEEEINDTFVTEHAINVWAGSALKLDFEFPNATWYNDDYPIKITLTNVSDKPLYNVNHKVQIEQGMKTYSKKKDGYIEKYETSEWYGTGTTVFNPGDQIIIEGTVNIFFESEIMEEYLEELIGIVDQIEKLDKTIKAIKKVTNIAVGLFNAVGSASKAIDAFLASDNLVLTEDKLELFKELKKSLGDFSADYVKTGNQSLDTIIKLGGTEVIDELNALVSSPEAVNEETIKSLINQINAAGNILKSSFGTKQKEEFNIFNSLRTLISAIPVKFVLKSVTMNDDFEENTTKIPWSYHTYDAGNRYFGVESVSDYIGNIMKAYMADEYDSAVPSLVQKIPGLDNPIDGDQAKRNVKMTEDSIKEFQAQTATGTTEFHCYIVRNKTSRAFSDGYNGVKNNNDVKFTLSSDNETATIDEDGVLTFSGPGKIKVLADSVGEGTLYVVGTTYDEELQQTVEYTSIFELQVLEEHDCSSNEWLTILEPTSVSDGVKVKRCDICDEIIDVDAIEVSNCKEHNFTDWQIDTPATDENMGIDKRVCQNCGFCEYKFTDAGTNTHTHTPSQAVEENRNAPTCLLTGSYDSVVYCSSCNKEISRETVTIPALEHSYNKTVITPTCMRMGYTVFYCISCGTSYVDGVIYPKVNHIYVDGFDECIYGCGTKKPDYVEPECQHSYSLSSQRDATCISSGEIVYRCSKCYEEYRDIIPRVDHIFEESNVGSTPYERGYTKFSCKNCSYEYRDNFLPYATDKSVLNSVISNAYLMKYDDYSISSYANVISICEKYKEYNTLDVSQIEIDNAIAEILQAEYGLEPYFDVNVIASNGEANISYNGNSGNAVGTHKILYGTNVTLTANASDGYKFVGWYDTMNNIYMNYGREYTFRLGVSMNLKAVFAKSGSTTLTFTNGGGWIISSETKTVEEWSKLASVDALAPKIPFSYGHTNGRWNYNNAEVLAKLQAGEDVVLSPEYDSVEVEYPDGITSVTDAPVLNLSFSYNTENKVGSFVMAAGFPEDITVDAIGIALYYKNAKEFDPTDNFTLLLNNKVTASQFSTTQLDDHYIVNMKNMTSKFNWAARGYLTYTKDNETKTVYSNQVNIIDRQQV